MACEVIPTEDFNVDETIWLNINDVATYNKWSASERDLTPAGREKEKWSDLMY